MEFLDRDYLWLLILLLPLLYLFSKNHSGLESIFDPDVLKKISVSNSALSLRQRNGLLLLSMVFVVLALARPVLTNGEITVDNTRIDVVVGFDISRSMQSDDVYPSRLALAKKKFAEFLNDFPEADVAVIGFSNRGFLIAPLSRDFHTLKYLVDNMEPTNVSQQGTDVLAALESAEDLMKESKKKALVLFTDGGDAQDFNQAATYAKTHGIRVYVYAVGTERGGAIKGENGMLKNRDGDIVITRLNTAIKTLALESGGAYLPYSLKNDDIDAIVGDIRSKFESKKDKEKTIRSYTELFYYPLLLAILLFLSALASLPKVRNNKGASRA